jgi:hypothetical protein
MGIELRQLRRIFPLRRRRHTGFSLLSTPWT